MLQFSSKYELCACQGPQKSNLPSGAFLKLMKETESGISITTPVLSENKEAHYCKDKNSSDQTGLTSNVWCLIIVMQGQVGTLLKRMVSDTQGQAGTLLKRMVSDTQGQAGTLLKRMVSDTHQFQLNFPLKHPSEPAHILQMFLAAREKGLVLKGPAVLPILLPAGLIQFAWRRVEYLQANKL
jgi:hypothetical protein